MTPAQVTAIAAGLVPAAAALIEQGWRFVATPAAIGYTHYESATVFIPLWAFDKDDLSLEHYFVHEVSHVLSEHEPHHGPAFQAAFDAVIASFPDEWADVVRAHEARYAATPEYRATPTVHGSAAATPRDVAVAAITASIAAARAMPTATAAHVARQDSAISLIERASDLLAAGDRFASAAAALAASNKKAAAMLTAEADAQYGKITTILAAEHAVE